MFLIVTVALFAAPAFTEPGTDDEPHGTPTRGHARRGGRQRDA
jgi:hypothetical protein